MHERYPADHGDGWLGIAEYQTRPDRDGRLQRHLVGCTEIPERDARELLALARQLPFGQRPQDHLDWSGDLGRLAREYEALRQSLGRGSAADTPAEGWGVGERHQVAGPRWAVALSKALQTGSAEDVTAARALLQAAVDEGRETP